MTDQKNESPDVEPQEPTDVEAQSLQKGTSGRKSFSKLRRELTDEELSSPAVQRMLLDEIERLDIECRSLAVFRDKFHTSDKSEGILQEKLKSKIAIEVTHVACVAVGGGALTFAPTIWSSQPSAAITAILGGVILLAGIAAKAIKS